MHEPTRPRTRAHDATRWLGRWGAAAVCGLLATGCDADAPAPPPPGPDRLSIDAPYPIAVGSRLTIDVDRREGLFFDAGGAEVVGIRNGPEGIFGLIEAGNPFEVIALAPGTGTFDINDREVGTERFTIRAEPVADVIITTAYDDFVHPDRGMFGSLGLMERKGVRKPAPEELDRYAFLPGVELELFGHLRNADDEVIVGLDLLEFTSSHPAVQVDRPFWTTVDAVEVTVVGGADQAVIETQLGGRVVIAVAEEDDVAAVETSIALCKRWKKDCVKGQPEELVGTVGPPDAAGGEVDRVTGLIRLVPVDSRGRELVHPDRWPVAATLIEMQEPEGAEWFDFMWLHYGNGVWFSTRCAAAGTFSLSLGEHTVEVPFAVETSAACEPETVAPGE